jgi:hypothetical protein
METAKKDIVLFIFSLVIGGLFPLTIFGTDFYFTADQEIQLHDTYYIFRPFELAIIAIGLTLFFIFLFRAIRTRFRNKLTLTFLALGTIVLGLVVVEIFEMVN